MPRATKRRGRKPDASSKSGKIRDLLKTGMAPIAIAKKVGCAPALVYNVRARIGGAKKRAGGRSAQAGVTRADGLAGILDAVSRTERERVQLRAALEKIRAVIDAALA